MDKNLTLLREQIAKKARLEAVLTTLKSQKGELEKRVRDLRTETENENADVEKLEKITLTSLLYKAIGKKDEKLDKERKEAYAAKLKYDTALAELDGIEERIVQTESELKPLRGCEPRYKNAVKEKAEAIRKRGGERAEKLIALEEKAVYITKNINELKEAIDAGRKAKSIANEVENKLEYAHHMATRDIMGGGMLAHISKHNALDEAQNLVECLQVQLRSFKTELADVCISADFQVNIDGFMRTADWFFDGFFVDLEVRERISNAQNEIAITLGHLNEALCNLDEVLNQNLREAEEANCALEQLTVETD